jgi:hypothetical protein
VKIGCFVSLFLCLFFSLLFHKFFTLFRKQSSGIYSCHLEILKSRLFISIPDLQTSSSQTQPLYFFLLSFSFHLLHFTINSFLAISKVKNTHFDEQKFSEPKEKEKMSSDEERDRGSSEGLLEEERDIEAQRNDLQESSSSSGLTSLEDQNDGNRDYGDVLTGENGGAHGDDGYDTDENSQGHPHRVYQLWK